MLLLHPNLSCFWEQELCENGSGRNTETACVSESNPLLSTCAKALRWNVYLLRVGEDWGDFSLWQQ